MLFFIKTCRRISADRVNDYHACTWNPSSLLANCQRLFIGLGKSGLWSFTNQSPPDLRAVG
jgi:hypothetical protein